jgi:hypothetical protein
VKFCGIRCRELVSKTGSCPTPIGLRQSTIATIMILDQSISMLTGSDFVQLIGEKKFLGVWKDIRDDVNLNRTSAVQGKVILDGLWSSLMTGFAFGSQNINIDKPMSRQLKVT